MSTGQFYRRVSTRIRPVNNVDRESAVRAYCEQWGSCWAVQVRGPVLLSNGREGNVLAVDVEMRAEAARQETEEESESTDSS